jgi:hypothetical protein
MKTKSIQPEEREWMQLKQGRPQTIEKERRCPTCKKLLSKFNLNKYCFNHHFIEQRKEDLKEEKKKREQYIRYQKSSLFFVKFVL